MTGPPLNEEVPVGSQAGIAAITRGISKAREDGFDINRSMHVLAAQIRALRADLAQRTAEAKAIIGERDALVAEVMTLQADTERLEWLAANEYQIWECNGRFSVHEVTEHRPITNFEHATFRAAIDAAKRGGK